MRGKHIKSNKFNLQRRITPACAGKTHRLHNGVHNLSDHPRVCGENPDMIDVMADTYGSPPRVRGKQGMNYVVLMGRRITPACAGKTGQVFPKGAASADHPRVCGENPERRFTMKRVHGSPPRVRGKPCQYRRDSGDGRITPACAGKTSESSESQPHRSDHPRVCGENCLQFCPLHQRFGSPPRVRGKLVEDALVYARIRITPACAGKTRRQCRAVQAGADHPRVCGENYQRTKSRKSRSGSPPRVRGKQL